jgi:AraC-like DNA-binding protein
MYLWNASILKNGREAMTSRLDRVKDWPLQAKRGGYRVEAVAHQLDVSTRWLRIYLEARLGRPPRSLFAGWRGLEIRRHRKEGKHGKEILTEVNLSHLSTLTRFLKRDGKTGLRELKSGGDRRAARSVPKMGAQNHFRIS